MLGIKLGGWSGCATTHWIANGGVEEILGLSLPALKQGKDVWVKR